MSILLIDYKGKEIRSGMIVKMEDFDKKSNIFYLYEELPNEKGNLYKYSTNGLIDKKDHLNNLHIDSGISLYNTEIKRWVCIGPAETCYKKLFP